jgi:hypothetical protein
MNHCAFDECQQGRIRCKTPLTCSGAGPDVDAAIRSIQFHRIPAPEWDDSPCFTPEQPCTWTAIALALLIASVGAIAFIAAVAA